MQCETHSLTNGLRVVLVPMSGSDTATVMVMTGTGSRYESERENGLAHFLEHMLFKGTTKRPTARHISEELDAVGSQYNAFTAKERTAYWAKVSARYLPVALDVISDIFLHSRLPASEITKERGAVIQEIDMYEDIPMRTVDNVFDALIFGSDHALGRTILGPKENIRSFSRQDFLAYRKRNYTPENSVVCVAGNFSKRAVLAKIKREFGHLTPSPSPKFTRFVLSQTSPRVSIRYKKTDQTQLMLGIGAYPYEHKDEYALEVLASILGGGMSSRLFIEVREKRGLAYSVRAWAERYPDTGYLAAQAGVEHAKLHKTVETILKEFKKLTRTRVSAEELRKAKAHIKGSLALDLETSDHRAEHAASSIINVGKVRTPDEIVKGLEAVTSNDVLRVAKDIFKTERLNLAIIGPHEDASRLQRLLRV